MFLRARIFFRVALVFFKRQTNKYLTKKRGLSKPASIIYQSRRSGGVRSDKESEGGTYEQGGAEEEEGVSGIKAGGIDVLA